MAYQIPKCYFMEMKSIPEVQRGIGVFRLWQKDHASLPEENCHISLKDGSVVISEKSRAIVESSIPTLEL